MKKIKLNTLENRHKINGMIMILPAFIYFIVFVYYPIAHLFKLSFFKYDLFKPLPEFIGLQNYIKLMTDADFLNGLGNTVYFALFMIIFSVGISFFLAVMIDKSKVLNNFYKIVYFMPYITPMVAVVLIWGWLFQPGEAGLINYFLSFFGIAPQSWLYNTRLAMPSLIVICVWQGLGYRTIIFIAGLKAIPQQYYEAAGIDGANAWQKIKYITFPCLKPIFQFVLIITTMEAFKIFIPMYVLTQGGPVGTTKTMVYNIYKQAFQFQKWGYAAVQAVVLFILLLSLALLQRRLTK
jgi:ABC-type sugar transport system permease subunit